MAELVTLARPYAKAAFEFAKAGKALQEWQDILTQAALVCSDSKVNDVLDSPTLTKKVKAESFIALFGKDLSPKLANFFQLLSENNRLPLLPAIAELFEHYKAEEEKTVDVEVTSAFAISKEMESTLAATLKEKLNRKVSLNTAIDESLIGGAIVRAGDTVIDGSVKGRLAKLADAMGA